MIYSGMEVKEETEVHCVADEDRETFFVILLQNTKTYF